MPPIGSIFFPLRVAPVRIENKIKGHLTEKPPKLNYAKINPSQYDSLLKPPNFDAANIKWFTVIITYS